MATEKMPDFCEGAFWALEQARLIQDEQRRAVYRLEEAVAQAAPEHQRAMKDALAPFKSGLSDNILGALLARLDARISQECMARMRADANREKQ